MKALIWKELRENFRWALLAALALGGAGLYAIFRLEYLGQVDFYYREGITICKEQYLLVTLFGFAATGAALGFLQVLPELKRDRWAALFHRPIPPSRIFWGKACAGVLLYLFAAGVPFAATVWYVATPGNFGTPFVPAMIKPGLADLCTGLAYYFAALLVALQGGPFLWRSLPLLAALYVSFFSVSVSLFRVAVESSLAMSLVLCIAGWGAVQARHSLAGRPWLAQFALLVVLFYGACGAGRLVQTLGAKASRRGVEKYVVWEVLKNGEPVREEFVDQILVSATGVDCQPFADPNFRPERVRSQMLGMNTATTFVGDAHGYQTPRWDEDYRESNTYLIAFDPYGRPRFEQWFRLGQTGEFIGMRPAEKQEFARLGSAGFAPPHRSIQGFAAETELDQVDGALLFIAERDSLRLARLGVQKIERVELPAHGRIYGMSHAWANGPNGGSVTFKGIAMETAFVVVDAQGKVAATLPYHQDVDRWGDLSMGVLPSMDRFVLQYEPSGWIPWAERKKMPSFVELLDAQGRVLKSHTIPPTPDSVRPFDWGDWVAGRLQCPAFFFGEMLYRRVGGALGSARLQKALAAQLGRDGPKTLRQGAAIVGVAVALAALTLAWAIRAQLPRRAAWRWSAAVLLLGLPGFVLFWLAGGRPQTAPCPACAKPRRLDEEACGACGAAWPAPVPTGIEIIDPPVALNSP